MKCPTCKGCGEVPVDVHVYDHRSNIEWYKCETCGGSGTVTDWTRCDVELPPVGVEVIAKSGTWFLPQVWNGKRWESAREELYLSCPTHWRPLEEQGE